MDTTVLLQILVIVIGVISLLGFFCTKTRGFGKHTTSTLLLILVLVLSALLLVSAKLEGAGVINILFSVIGFAGGLFAGKDKDGCCIRDNDKQTTNPKSEVPR